MNVILENLYRLQTLDAAGVKHNSVQAAGLRAGIPEGMLTNYDRARARGKKGIALLRNNVCTNCRMQVPVAVRASLLGGTIQVCGNCGLYLFLPEPVPLPPVPDVTPSPAARPRKRKGVIALTPCL